MSSSSFIISNDANGSFTIPFATIENTLTSISLFGRGVGNYAQPFAQNELNLLTHFASPNSPVNPLLGQIWYNSSTQLLNYYVSPNTWYQVASQQWVNGNFATLAELNALAAKEASDIAALSAKEASDVANLQAEITALAAKEASDIASLGTQIGSTYVTKQDLYSPPAGTPAVATAAGGTGLTTIGTAGQLLQVNSSGNGLVYVSPASELVTSFDGRVGAITLASSDINTALGYVPPSPTGTGASGNWNINAASATKVDYYLSPGSYVSGSAFNGSAAETWSVLASTANNANYVVARDSGGNIWASTLTATGNVECSNTVQCVTMNTSGNINCSGAIYSAGDITAFNSDERLKHDIHTIGNALTLTKQLRGVYYKRKDIENHKGNIGFIAQEIQKVIPEVVHMGDDGYLKVAYQNVVGLLVEAIKELSDEVESLKDYIKSIKGDAK
jgi:hypothetical protein